MEKTAFVSGAPLADGIEQLDRVLRHLAATVEAEGRSLPVQDDTGRLHLLNLENLRALSLTGEPGAATALARHIAAELALNP